MKGGGLVGIDMEVMMSFHIKKELTVDFRCWKGFQGDAKFELAGLLEVVTFCVFSVNVVILMVVIVLIDVDSRFMIIIIVVVLGIAIQFMSLIAIIYVLYRD